MEISKKTTGFVELISFLVALLGPLKLFYKVIAQVMKYWVKPTIKALILYCIILVNGFRWSIVVNRQMLLAIVEKKGIIPFTQVKVIVPQWNSRG